jgi:hypothetical protein
VAPGERLIVEGMLNVRPGAVVKAVAVDVDASTPKAAMQPTPSHH